MQALLSARAAAGTVLPRAAQVGVLQGPVGWWIGRCTEGRRVRTTIPL